MDNGFGRQLYLAMTTSRDRFTLARRISTDNRTYRHVATVSTRPIRVAYILNVNLTIDQLTSIVKYSCAIWGGYYSLMVPTNGMHIDDHWFKSLANHDADYIMICGDLDVALKHKIHAAIQPFILWSWDENVLTNHLSHDSVVGSISMEHIFISLYKRNRPIEKSRFCIPQLLSSSPYFFHSLAKFGAMPESYQELITTNLGGEYQVLNSATLADYLESQRLAESKLTPIHSTKLGLDIHHEGGGTFGFYIVLSGQNIVQDFCLFWNYRMHSSFYRQEPLFLPISAFRRKNAIADLAAYCKKYVLGTDFVVLASASVNKRTLASLKEKLKYELLGSKIRHIDIKYSNFVTGKSRVYEKARREEVSVEEEYFKIRDTVPDIEDFSTYAHNAKWVTDVQFQAEGKRPSGFLPPKFPGISELLSGNPDPLLVEINRGYSARLANGHMSYRVSVRPNETVGYIPTEDELFNSLIKSRNFVSINSEKSKYVQGIIGLLGTLNDTLWLRKLEPRSLLRQMVSQKAYTISEIKSILKPGKKQSDIDAMYGLLSDLTRKGVFFRGMKIRCPACDLTRWYSLNSVDEKMHCAGCLTEFQPAIDAPFYYALNELLARGVDQGALPVLLTLSFLQNLSSKSFLYRPGVILQKNGMIDVDIIASCDGHLVLVECKDLHQNSSRSINKEILTQLYSLVEIAEQLDVRVVFLSTLLPVIPSELQNKIELLNKRLKGKTHVHVLTSHDLERGYKSTTLNSTSTIERHMQFDDYLPKVSNRNTGWIREDGSRSVSF